MKINPRYLTEGERRRVDEQRAHENDVNEKQKARNLSNSRIVALLQVRVTAVTAGKSVRSRRRSAINNLRNRLQLVEDWQVDVTDAQRYLLERRSN